MIAPARAAALDALLAISAAVARSRLLLRDDRDKALAAEILIGVQRWRATIDHLLASFARRGLDRLDAEIVEILRLSTYQLLHLTRVPAAAVVDDAVKLAGRAGKRSAGGLVNAVLRALARRRRSLPLPPRPEDLGDRTAVLDYLAITLSHPRWLVERWLDRFGFEATERWLQFNNAAAGLTLRANRLRNTPEELAERLGGEVRVVRGQFAADALVVTEGRPLAGPGLAAGWFVVQDEASQLVALLTGARPGERVLDTCASPGGKTTQIAALMQRDGLLIACDVRAHRMDLLRRTVQSSGATNIRLVQADFLAAAPFLRPFDCVFVDAPCSGLGTLRRDPDIKWRRREEDLARFADGELQLLQCAAEAVAPRGRLIYSTCSSEPDENEAVAAAFLARTDAFVHVGARDAAPTLAPVLVDARGHLRTFPHAHGLEAFFGTVFVRKT
jgi:16S rRNA (cytosine967-C5)-methyltransferase